MNKKSIASFLVSGLMVMSITTVAYADSTSYDFSFTTNYSGGDAKQEFVVSTSNYVNVAGSQNSTETTAKCYYSIYKKNSLWFDELVVSDYPVSGNGDVVHFSSSKKLEKGTHYIKITCATPYTKGSGKISY